MIYVSGGSWNGEYMDVDHVGKTLRLPIKGATDARVIEEYRYNGKKEVGSVSGELVAYVYEIEVSR